MIVVGVKVFKFDKLTSSASRDFEVQTSNGPLALTLELYLREGNIYGKVHLKQERRATRKKICISLLFKRNGKIDDETLLNQLRQQRLGDGHSGSDSKHSDTMSDQGNSNIPYDILLQDLTQAKRQLLELHNLVSDLKTYFFK
mgnify:CR=1 FL=1